jgi:CheY-like chemotaxis protein
VSERESKPEPSPGENLDRLVTNGAKKRIFYLDDRGFTRLAKLVLSPGGRYLFWEEDQNHEPEQSLQAARDFRPDLILMNVIMPHISGEDLAARFRADPLLSKTPIVFLTGMICRAENGSLLYGVPAYAKPVPREDLVRIIESHLPAGPDTWDADAGNAPGDLS